MNEELDIVLDMVARLLEFISNNVFWLLILVPLFLTDKKSKVKASFKEAFNKPTKDNFFNLYHHIIDVIDDEDMEEEIKLDAIYTNDKDYNYNGSFESFTEEVNHIETHEIDYSEPMSQEIDEDELLSHEEWQQLSNHTSLRTKRSKKNNLRQMMLHKEILSKPKGLQ